MKSKKLKGLCIILFLLVSLSFMNQDVEAWMGWDDAIVLGVGCVFGVVTSVFTNSCDPYLPVIATSDECEKCHENNPFGGCDEYKCSAIGSNCKFSASGAPGGGGFCSTLGGDVAPRITDCEYGRLSTLESFSLVQKTPTYCNLGVLDRTIDYYFYVETDLPAICKRASNPNFPDGGQRLRLTGERDHIDGTIYHALSKDNPAEEASFQEMYAQCPEDGSILCKDYIQCTNGGGTSPPYEIRFKLKDAPDTEGPIISRPHINENTSLQSGMMLHLDIGSSFELSIAAVDPANVKECRFAMEDKPYLQMTDKFDCVSGRLLSGEIFEDEDARGVATSQRYVMKCDKNVNLPSEDEFNIYVACSDDLNNVASESYALRKGKVMDMKLQINGEDYTSGLVSLEERNHIIRAITSGGDDGKSLCSYRYIFDSDASSFTDDNILFVPFGSIGTTHDLSLNNFLRNKGRYIFNIKCGDAFGNDESKYIPIEITKISGGGGNVPRSSLSIVNTGPQRSQSDANVDLFITLTGGPDGAGREAECKHTIDFGEAFEAWENEDLSLMGEEFGGSQLIDERGGSTKYSADLGTLTDDTDYKYYILCKDSADAFLRSIQTVEFRVDLPEGDGGGPPGPDPGQGGSLSISSLSSTDGQIIVHTKGGKGNDGSASCAIYDSIAFTTKVTDMSSNAFDPQTIIHSYTHTDEGTYNNWYVRCADDEDANDFLSRAVPRFVVGSVPPVIPGGSISVNLGTRPPNRIVSLEEASFNFDITTNDELGIGECRYLFKKEAYTNQDITFNKPSFGDMVSFNQLSSDKKAQLADVELNNLFGDFTNGVYGYYIACEKDNKEGYVRGFLNVNIPQPECVIDDDCTSTPQICELEKSEWRRPDGSSISGNKVTEGEKVALYVEGRDCEDGTEIDFEIYEDDLGPDGEPKFSKASTFGENEAVVEWISEWECDGEIADRCTLGDPEYYFKAIVDDKDKKSGDLEVKKALDPVCQDGVVDAGEECDQTSGSCIILSSDYASGSWTCNSDCIMNIAECTPVAPDGNCGDGAINTDETCDGTNWGAVTGCADLDGFSGGTLACKVSGVDNECHFDTTSCISIGDRPGESCTTSDNCGGILNEQGVCIKTQPNCLIEQPPQNPIECGNSQLDAGEACDGSLLNGKSCNDFGFGGGSLSCNNECNWFITSLCTSPEPPKGGGECKINECPGIYDINNVCKDIGGDNCPSTPPSPPSVPKNLDVDRKGPSGSQSDTNVELFIQLRGGPADYGEGAECRYTNVLSNALIEGYSLSLFPDVLNFGPGSIGTTKYTANVVVPVGDHTYYVKCKDSEEKLIELQTITFKVEIPSAQQVSIVRKNPEGVYGKKDIELEVETNGGIDNGQSVSCTFSGIGSGGTDSSPELITAGRYKHAITMTNVADGDYTISVECRDRADQVVTDSWSVNVQEDNTSPEIQQILTRGSSKYITMSEDSKCEVFEGDVIPTDSADWSLVSKDSTNGARQLVTASGSYYFKCSDEWDNPMSEIARIHP